MSRSSRRDKREKAQRDARPAKTAPSSDAPPTAPPAPSTAPAGPAPATPKKAPGAPPELSRPLAPAAPTSAASRPRVSPPSIAAAPPRRVLSSACYVDFENIFYSALQHGIRPSILRMVRQLNRLARQQGGEGWTSTAVYASWDQLATHARHAQDEWAMLGWRPVAVPTREDYQSKRPVKNLVDFVMSMDMLEAARDRGYERFCIVSGDSDFCEVAERLKRLGRRIVVVALRPNLSLRLSEAADECIVWGFPDISGDESLPESRYRRFEEVVKTPARSQGEEPYQVLLRAVRLAERDQGSSPVSWDVIRDEYLRRMVSMTEEEAEQFARMLNEAGFVSLVRTRGKDGKTRAFLSIPR